MKILQETLNPILSKQLHDREIVLYGPKANNHLQQFIRLPGP